MKLPRFTPFASIKAAVAAAKRIANRTRKPVKVIISPAAIRRTMPTVPIPRESMRDMVYTRKAAANPKRRRRNPPEMVITQTMHPTPRGHGSQKKGEGAPGASSTTQTITQTSTPTSGNKTSTSTEGGPTTTTGSAARGTKRNPSWLDAGQPKKMPDTGHWVTKFTDGRGHVGAEMFERSNEATRLLVRNPKGPKYSAKRGWSGGDPRRLYAFVDKRTGSVRIAPGGSNRGIGPEVDVRLATRAEAEIGWQSPLHKGWKVNPRGKRRRR